VTTLSALVLTVLVGVAHAGNFVEENGSDFDCDGLRDLVLDMPYENVGGKINSGAVSITYSTTGTSQQLTQDSPGIPGDLEENDDFGQAYTAYDRNHDGCDDLVVSAPGEDVNGFDDAGMVWVIPGSPTGLDTSGTTTYTQDSPGFPGAAEVSDAFGWELASGMTSDGTPFLLITSVGENDGAGAVHYVRSDVVSIITQNSTGVPGTAEPHDMFGSPLAVSDTFFAVGSVGEDFSGSIDAGMVHVFSHGAASASPTPLAAATQDTTGVSGTAEPADFFGFSLSVLPYRQSEGAPVGAALAVGSVRERVGDVFSAGMAHLLYVSASGVVSEIAAVTQNTSGVTGTPEREDSLGEDLVVANLDPNTTVARPDSMVWAVAASGELTASGERSAVHAFPPGWQPGQRDIWLEDGTNGLPANSLRHIGRLRASASHLHVSSALYHECHAVAWQNLLGTSTDLPATLRADGCR
jgi:hypothetical protein